MMQCSGTFGVHTSTSSTAPHSPNSFFISATEKDQGKLSTKSFLRFSGLSTSSVTATLSTADCNWNPGFLVEEWRVSLSAEREMFNLIEGKDDLALKEWNLGEEW